MKKLITFSFLCLSLTFEVCAALSPYYQSIREYESLLQDPKLAEALGQAEEISNIQRDALGFVVTSPKKTVRVNVIYDPQNQPGPRKFHFEDFREM